MTHDPFVPPAGSFPAAPPPPDGSGTPGGPATPVAATTPSYPYGAPLYTLPPLRSTAGLGVAAIVLASVWTVTQVVSLLLAPQSADALQQAGEVGLAAADSAFTAYDGVAILSGVVQVAAYLVTCFWLHASRSTAVAANPKFVHERSRVWAWLGWWVPVVLFWFPFQVVRDVRRATSPRPVSGIGGWWAAWLVFLGASNLAGRLTVNGAQGSADAAAQVLVPLEAVATVSMIVALVLWIRIVRDITRAQDERIAAAHQTTP